MNEIYVEQIDTYPEEITEYIKKYSCSLQKYIHQGIPQDDFSVRCALENKYFWSDDIIQQLYKEFWNIAVKYFWVGYHVTRIQSNDEILQGGLIRLEFDSYCSRLTKVLKYNGIGEKEINYAIARVKKMYDGYLGERKERVCFFAPGSLLYKGNFDYMAKNYGGEIAERSFENHEGMENVWKVLANTGTPAMVKFRFRLNDLYEFQHDDVFMEILRFLTSKMYIGYDYSVGIGQHIKKSIPPEDILEIKKIEIREYD